ncbi:hypothetical protein ACQJBY_019662 [Aegilops geniculata]
MYSMRDLLGFVVGAAITAAFVVLLVPSSAPSCPCGLELSLDTNGSQAHLMSTKNLSTVPPVKSKEEDSLAELLRSAAMEDKTVILTFVNEALTLPGSLLELFLESFRLGVRTQPLLKHLVIVAMDAKALERCQHLHPLCYPLGGGGRSSDGAPGGMTAAEVTFMSKDYVELMWARNRFQARVLELGFGFVFTDVDIVWFRNPLLRFPIAADIALACDQFLGNNPYDLDKAANGGFVYARPNARTLAFFQDWYEARNRFPGEHDQFVFGEVKKELSARHGVTVMLIDTVYFSGVCENKKNFYEVCTYHANCLIGLQKKIDTLAGVLDEWKQFRAEQELLGNSTTALIY